MQVKCVWFMGHLLISCIPERLASTGIYQIKIDAQPATFDLDSHIASFEFSELFKKHFHCPSYVVS